MEMNPISSKESQKETKALRKRDRKTQFRKEKEREGRNKGSLSKMAKIRDMQRKRGKTEGRVGETSKRSIHNCTVHIGR